MINEYLVSKSVSPSSIRSVIHRTEHNKVEVSFGQLDNLVNTFLHQLGSGLILITEVNMPGQQSCGRQGISVRLKD